MRSEQAYKEEIRACVQAIDTILVLSDDNTLPNFIRKDATLQSLFRLCLALKTKIKAILDKVDEHYWCQVDLFEEKARLIDEKSQLLQRQFFTRFNQCTQTYLNEFLGEHLPTSKTALMILNAVTEVTFYEGEYYAPSQYGFKRQLDAIRFFEQKSQRSVPALTLKGKHTEFMHKKLCSRLSNLILTVTALAQTSLDENEEEERLLKEEILFKCQTFKRLLKQDSQQDSSLLLVSCGELTQALLCLSDYYKELTTYNEKRLNLAKESLQNIEFLLPRFEKQYAHLQIDNVDPLLKESLLMVTSVISKMKKTTLSLKEAISNSYKTRNYNAIAEQVLMLKDLKRDLFKLNTLYEHTALDVEKKRERDEKEYFLSQYIDFKYRQYPCFKRRLIMHKKEGMLNQKKSKEILSFILDIEHYLDAVEKVIPREKELFFNVLTKALRFTQSQQFQHHLNGLQFKLIPFQRQLDMKEQEFFQTNHFDENLVKRFKEKYTNPDVFNHCLKNTQKILLIDGWIETFKALSSQHQAQAWFEEVLQGLWTLKLRCNKPYSDYRFATDAVQFLRQKCDEESLIKLSRDDGELLYQLRTKVFKPLYDFCYRLGIFRERSISIFASPIEQQIREMIYRARLDCFQVQQGKQPINGGYSERVLRTAFVL